MGKDDKKLFWGAIAVFVLFAIGVITYNNGQLGFNPSAFSAVGAGGLQGIATTSPQTTGAAVPCQDDGTNDIQVVVRNTLNSTLQYLGGTVAVVDSSGKVLNTGGLAQGATLARATISFPCSQEAVSGKVYLLGAANGTSASASYNLGSGKSQAIDLNAALAGSLTMTMRNITNGGNVSSVSVQNVIAEAGATTMSPTTTTTRSVNVDIQVTNASAAFGHANDGLLWSIDTADSAVFSDSAMSVLGTAGITLTETPCPARATSANSANRCYKSAWIKQGDGVVTIRINLNSDLGGDPGTSADPVVYIDDYVTFQDTDGSIKTDVKNSANADVGAPRMSITLDNS